MPKNNRDPLGLTLPPPDISDRRKIVPGHSPNDADIWDNGGKAWKICFTVYRSTVFGNSDREIAKMLGHSDHGGDIDLKRHRIRYKEHNGENCYRYVKFSQAFVDRWIEIAKKELTAIHGNEEYALSLLPQEPAPADVSPELKYEVVVEKINQILKSPDYDGIEFDEKQTKDYINRLVFIVSPNITFDLGRASYIAKLLNEALGLTDKPKFHARCALNNNWRDLKSFYLGVMNLD